MATNKSISMDSVYDDLTQTRFNGLPPKWYEWGSTARNMTDTLGLQVNRNNQFNQVNEPSAFPVPAQATIVPSPVVTQDYTYDQPDKLINTGMPLNELQRLQAYNDRTKAIQDQTSANQVSNWASFGLNTVGQISNIAGTWANYELQRKHLSKQNALLDTQTQDLKEQMERRKEEYARLKRVRNKTTTAMNKGATITRSVL